MVDKPCQICDFLVSILTTDSWSYLGCVLRIPRPLVVGWLFYDTTIRASPSGCASVDDYGLHGKPAM